MAAFSMKIEHELVEYRSHEELVTARKIMYIASFMDGMEPAAKTPDMVIAFQTASTSYKNARVAHHQWSLDWKVVGAQRPPTVKTLLLSIQPFESVTGDRFLLEN
ncbi:hypothetical protein Plhal304r1_c021g0075741 [Plasmopara halstedii]